MRFLLIIAIVALGGCTNVQKIKRLKIQGHDFSSYLAREYQAYAKMKTPHKKLFARKGLRAAKGLEVLPEDPRDHKIERSKMNDLNWGYSRIKRLVVRGSVKDKFPHELARSQILFDCWVEAEKYSDDELLNRCKPDFVLELAALDQLWMQRKEKLRAKDKQEQSKLERFKDKFVIYFGFDSYSLKDEAREIIGRIADKVRSLSDYTVSIIGHTDRAGSSAYNKYLSGLRADKVMSGLVEHGVRAHAVKKKSYGEDAPAVVTADGVSLRANRRVEIEVEGTK